MSQQLKEHLKERKTWLRGLYMLLFVVFYCVAEIVITAVVLFQFLMTLFTGSTNERLLKLGQSLGSYVYQILQFLTFNSDYHPYPFGAWPKGPPKEPAKRRKSTTETEMNDDIKEIEKSRENDGD